MGRLAILDQVLVSKIAKKLKKRPINIVKSVSGLASRRSISSEVALILFAKKNGIGTSVVRRKLGSDKQIELRSFMNSNGGKDASGTTRRKQTIVPGLPMTSDNGFQDPFLSVSLSKPATEAYQILYILENSLRAFIARVLLERYGKDWWKEVLAKKATASIAVKVADRKNNESTNWHHGKRGVHEIYYTDYDHLLSIIRSFDSEFNPFFKKIPERNLIGNLTSLVPTRNVTAHNNPITSDDLDRLRVYAKEWLKYMTHIFSSPR